MVSWFPISMANAQDVILGEEVFDRVVVDDVWDGSFAFGLNGKSGNSENMDINLSVDAKRDDDASTTNLLLTYFYGRNQIATSTDRLFSEARHERKLSNPNFSWYLSGSFEWDRFKGFDYRVALHSGLGILLYEFDDRFLKSRIGAGTSREFGGLNDEWTPELQFGMDWERHVTKKTKLFANTDYFPSLDDFGDFRLNTRAGFETLLDADMGMSLRVFVFNRFDNTPDPGFNSNDVDYGLSLAFGF
jgi:putative salt-induced outer membrane protein YdiY